MLNQSFTNIQLDYMFILGLREFNEVNEKTTFAVDEALLQTGKTIMQ